MRLKFLPRLVSAAIVALVSGCGGRVAVQNTNEGTGGSGGGGAGGGAGTGGTAGGTQGPCDLSLIASGALPRRSQRNTESVAVAASSKSYTIAYAERDPTDNTSRNTAIVKLDDTGQLGIVEHNEMLHCPTGPSAGAAAIFGTTGSPGLAAFAAGSCSGGGAGAMFFHLTANAGPGSPNLALNPDFSSLSLGPHALAPLGTNRFAFVYVPITKPAGGAQLATLTGTAFDGNPVELFGAEPLDAAAVTTSSSVQAILGHLSSGKEMLQLGAPDADGGGSPHLLGTQPWGAVTTIGGRVAVLLPTATGLEYRLFNFNQQVDKHALSDVPTPDGDITSLGNRLIAVGAGAGAISLYRIDNANGTPGAGVKVPTHLPASSVGQIAIAAARSTVAVVYTDNSARGQWALFSCKN